MTESKHVRIDPAVVAALANEKNFSGLVNGLKRIWKRRGATPLKSIQLDPKTLAVAAKLYGDEPITTFMSTNKPAAKKK